MYLVWKSDDVEERVSEWSFSNQGLNNKILNWSQKAIHSHRGVQNEGDISAFTHEQGKDTLAVRHLRTWRHCQVWENNMQHNWFFSVTVDLKTNLTSFW